MPTEKLSVRKIKEILRLKAQGFSNRQIGQSIRISPGTVCRYLQLAKSAGLIWSQVASLSEDEVEAQLFQSQFTQQSVSKNEPDLLWVHQELKHKDVTRFLLWQAYKSRFPGTYSNS